MNFEQAVLDELEKLGVKFHSQRMAEEVEDAVVKPLVGAYKGPARNPALAGREQAVASRNKALRRLALAGGTAAAVYGGYKLYKHLKNKKKELKKVAAYSESVVKGDKLVKTTKPDALGQAAINASQGKFTPLPKGTK